MKKLNIKFGGMLDKILNEGKTTQVLRETFIVLFLVISVPSFSQIGINHSNSFTIYIDGSYINVKSEKEAFNKAIKLKNEFPEKIITTVITNRKRYNHLNIKIIDTLQISGFWHTWGKYGDYFRFLNGSDIIKVETDTVLFWQRDLEVIRTKTFGKISYKNTSKILFQFVRDSIVKATDSTVTVRTFATQFHGVKYFVDDVLEFDYSDLNTANPGSAIIYGQNVFRHTREIKGLKPKTVYLLRVEGNASDGSINYIEFEIETL